MKIGWIAGAALAVALVLVLWWRSGDETTQQLASTGRLGHGVAADGSGPAGSGMRAGTPAARPAFGAPHHGLDGGASGGATDSGGERRADRVNGLPSAGSGVGSSGSGSHAANASGGTVVHSVASDATHREAPAPGSSGPVAAFNGGVDSDGQPIPDVVYQAKDDKVFPTDSQEEVGDAGKISGAAGTISFWLQPQWAAGNQEDATFVQLGDSGMEVMKNVNYLRFQFHDSDGGENGLGSNLGAWSQNEWHQVTATWQDTQLSLYVDGQLVSQKAFNRAPEFQPETKLYVGSAFPNGAAAAPASIGSLLVTNMNSSAGDVGSVFHNGPPKK